jgi:hypothetical protein
MRKQSTPSALREQPSYPATMRSAAPSCFPRSLQTWHRAAGLSFGAQIEHPVAVGSATPFYFLGLRGALARLLASCVQCMRAWTWPRAVSAPCRPPPCMPSDARRLSCCLHVPAGSFDDPATMPTSILSHCSLLHTNLY